MRDVGGVLVEHCTSSAMSAGVRTCSLSHRC
jgi:hypothetical protein